MKNLLRHFLLWLFIALAGTVTAQVIPGINCATAGEITSLDSFTVPQVISGVNSFFPACFEFPTANSAWFKFKPVTTGQLHWTCTPILPATELDWALYDITNGCDAGLFQELSCNYSYDSSLSKPIGMVHGGTGGLSEPITVEGCHTYALFIDNYDNNTSGLHFDWDNSTFNIDTAKDLSSLTLPNPYTLQISTPYSFSWIDCRNDSVLNTSTTIFTPGRSGQFGALVYDGFCNYKTDCFSVSAPTGIANIENLTCALWPNPAGKELHVSLLNSSNTLTARITNLQGCQMGAPLKLSSPNIQIPISTLPTGLYFLILETEQGSVVKKFAKE
jgi:hypothetical protein